ncbi:MAG TPA: DUF2807 domain-containing protein [Polyangiaceae bacterium]
MRIRRRPLFLLALFALAFSGCDDEKKADSGLQGDGVAHTETRDVPAFTRLSVGSRIDVSVVIGEPSKLELRGDKNLLPHVTGKVENGTLKLDTDVKVKPNIPLTLKLRVPRLDGVSVSKGGSIAVEKLSAQKFEVQAGGGGKIRASGSAQELLVDGGDAGQVNLAKLPVQSATVRLERAARVELGYVEKLDVKLDGAARVVYEGTPEIKQDIKGRARLVRRDSR